MVIARVIDGEFKGAVPWLEEAKEGCGAIGGEGSVKESVLTILLVWPLKYIRSFIKAYS